jgi:hypothetical protein
MIDLNKYSYREKPFTQVKQFSIHPLSDKGFTEYLSRDSNARKYLNRIDPKLLEELEEQDRMEELKQYYYENQNNNHSNLQFQQQQREV